MELGPFQLTLVDDGGFRLDGGGIGEREVEAVHDRLLGHAQGGRAGGIRRRQFDGAVVDLVVGMNG